MAEKEEEEKKAHTKTAQVYAVNNRIGSKIIVKAIKNEIQNSGFVVGSGEQYFLFDLRAPESTLVADNWPSNHVLVNNAIKIKRVPAMDMTYQSTVRTVQIIVHMIWNK